MPQSKKKHGIFRAMGNMFASGPRYRTPMPPNFNPPGSPWLYTAGPVFTPQAAGAILHSRKTKPQQSLFGYAYRVANPNKFNVLQPSQLYAPKSVTVVGINIQQGTMGVFTPAVNDDGTYVDDGTVNITK